MSIYSPELKEQMARKLRPPGNQSVATISRETGISAPTLGNKGSETFSVLK